MKTRVNVNVESVTTIIMTTSQNNWPFIINVGNSIIGVTVLAMPFCFKTCGIILGTLLLFFATWLTIVSCQLLMKAGVSSRRRSYSLLAYFTLGGTGKLVVEIGMIGLQLGTLVAQIVIIGDLGPGIVSKAMGLQNNDHLRSGLIIFLCLFVGLPLGLLKDVRALSKTSTLCIMFYTFFSFYVVLLSIPKLITGDWINKVNFWRFEGFFQCLPIFSFAFGCQTQLFITYDALAEPSLKRINSIVGSAVNMCTVSYLLVGFFGYIAFCDVEELSGDIINHFKEDVISDILKMCFVFSIAVSIPLIVFPCRVSLYTLCFPNVHRSKDDVPGSWKIPEFHFKVITVIIIVGSMIIGILIPNIEFVLGLNGATTGTLICYIFPALFFLNVMSEKAEGKLSGRLVLILGLTIMIASTYTTLSKQNRIDTTVSEHIQPQPMRQDDFIPRTKPDIEDIKKDGTLNMSDGKESNDKTAAERHEPPVPQEPDDSKVKQVDANVDDFEGRKAKEKDVKEGEEQLAVDRIKSNEKDKEVNDGVKKEEAKSKRKDEEEEKKADDEAEKEKELKEFEEKQKEAEKKQNEILAKLEQQQEEQEKIIKEQKEILEQLKEHNEKHKDDDLQQHDDIDQKQPGLIENKQNLVKQQDSDIHLPGIQNNLQGQVQNNIANNPGLNVNQQGLGDQAGLQNVQQFGGMQPNAQPIGGVQQNMQPIGNMQPNVQQSVQQGDFLAGAQNVVQDAGKVIAHNVVPQGQLNGKIGAGGIEGGVQQNLVNANLPLGQKQVNLNQNSNDGIVLNGNQKGIDQRQNHLDVNVVNAQKDKLNSHLDSDVNLKPLNNQVNAGLLQNNVPAGGNDLVNVQRNLGVGQDVAGKKEDLVDNIDSLKHRGKRDTEENIDNNNENNENVMIDHIDIKKGDTGTHFVEGIEDLNKDINAGLKAHVDSLVGKDRR
ncbi:hypothetical protein ACF0H5_000810 [Mactra antiquata]